MPQKTLKNPPTVLILASGRGERFTASGGATHKLQALLAGKTVLQHTLDAVKASGLPWHLEDDGHAGMGDTIAAAVRKTANAWGWLILPADLPLIQPATLRQVAAALQTSQIVQPYFVKRHGSASHLAQTSLYGHPVGFSKVCQQSLLNLSGDKGASIIIKDYLATKLVANDVGIITDIDTLEDLAHAQYLWHSRVSSHA